MLTRHSGAANRLSPSAIADAALAWPPPVSEVMIRNFLVGSLVIDSCLQSSSRGALLKIAFVTSDNGSALTQRNRRYSQQAPAALPPDVISSTAVRAS